MLTVKEVAERIGRSPRTVRKLIQDGKLKAKQRKIKGYYYVIDEKDLQEYLESKE